MKKLKYAPDTIAKLRWREHLFGSWLEPYEEVKPINKEMLLSAFLGASPAFERSRLYSLVSSVAQIDTDKVDAEEKEKIADGMNGIFAGGVGDNLFQKMGVQFSPDLCSFTLKGREIKFERLSSFLRSLDADLKSLRVNGANLSKILHEMADKALTNDRLGECFSVSPEIAGMISCFPNRFSNASIGAGFIRPYLLNIAENIHAWAEFQKNGAPETYIADMTSNLVTTKRNYEILAGAETQKVIPYEQYRANEKAIMDSTAFGEGRCNFSVIEPFLFPDEVTADAVNNTIAPRKREEKLNFLDKAGIIAGHLLKHNEFTTFAKNIRSRSFDEKIKV